MTLLENPCVFSQIDFLWQISPKLEGNRMYSLFIPSKMTNHAALSDCNLTESHTFHPPSSPVLLVPCSPVVGYPSASSTLTYAPQDMPKRQCVGFSPNGWPATTRGQEITHVRTLCFIAGLNSCLSAWCLLPLKLRKNLVRLYMIGEFIFNIIYVIYYFLLNFSSSGLLPLPY